MSTPMYQVPVIRYHINKHGVPALCKAQDGNCPLGGAAQHFRTEKEAQIFMDNQHKQTHGLLPGVGMKSLQESIDEIKSNDSDLTSSLPDKVINYDTESEVKIYYFTPDSVRESCDLSVDGVKNRLAKEHHIEITDLASTTEEQRLNLLSHVYYESYKRTGNVVGFLKSDKKGSYQKTMSYSKENMVGTFNEIYGYQTILSEVGWHKDSGQGAASERTTLNQIMDKESLEIAREINRFSEKNKAGLFYPASGLIGSIQALRVKGWKPQQIKNAAIDHRLDSIVYSEYNVKPKATSGATEMKRLMMRGEDKDKSINDILKDKLGWDV